MLCGVMGFPIQHSLSPVIYQAFALRTGISLVCEKIEVPADKFSASMQMFIAQGGKGVGITVPLKTIAYEWVALASPEAHEARAVSMIHIDKSQIAHGYNFDGMGLVDDFKRQGMPLANKRILLLGAGGAAKGVLPALLAELPKELIIANRTLKNAQALASHYSGVSACEYAQLTGAFDVLINATSVSLTNESLPLSATCVSDQSMCYDLMYSKTETSFLHWARVSGAVRRVDGLGMLVSHCAYAFHVWTGVVLNAALTADVLREVRANINKL